MYVEKEKPIVLFGPFVIDKTFPGEDIASLKTRTHTLHMQKAAEPDPKYFCCSLIHLSLGMQELNLHETAEDTRLGCPRRRPQQHWRR